MDVPHHLINMYLLVLMPFVPIGLVAVDYAVVLFEYIISEFVLYYFKAKIFWCCFLSWSYLLLAVHLRTHF